MFQVLITTTAFTANGCSTSSIIVPFYQKDDANDAVANACRNTNSIKNITVSAVLLNPDYK